LLRPDTGQKEADSRSISIRGEKGGALTLIVSGHMSLANLDTMMSEVISILNEQAPSRVTVDLSGVDYMDSAGALLLIEMEEEATQRSIPFSVEGMSEKARDILRLVNRQALTTEPINPREQHMGAMEQIGVSTAGMVGDVGRSMTFLGELIAEIISSLMKPGSVRWGDTLVYMKKAGVDGLPILALISFLLGLIMAFMSSLQLKQFGANIYVASLVGLAMVRELGPIMTAILVAGRSGSAFAAEIGTMKVNEEVDALLTMGFDPVRFLAVPKVFAAMVVVPVLTLFSDLFAIFGGLLVGVLGLEITPYTYLRQTATSFDTFDIVAGIVKSMVFAMLISGIGCQRGFEVRGGAEAVGNATTSAVVSSLFLIIVTDSTFAVILNYLR
jgi:phospholipid/cholesterol/gamma-HCH transport system permease protein